MKSAAWDAKRKLVFERDDHRCQECGGLAEGVHHWTYERFGNEDLADLSAVCWKCHKKLHPEKRRRKKKRARPKKQKRETKWPELRPPKKRKPKAPSVFALKVDRKKAVKSRRAAFLER